MTNLKIEFRNFIMIRNFSNETSIAATVASHKLNWVLIVFVGDTLLSVDGQEVDGLSHQQVGDILKNSSDLVKITVHRSPKCMFTTIAMQEASLYVFHVIGGGGGGVILRCSQMYVCSGFAQKNIVLEGMWGD